MKCVNKKSRKELFPLAAGFAGKPWNERKNVFFLVGSRARSTVTTGDFTDWAELFSPSPTLYTVHKYLLSVKSVSRFARKFDGRWGEVKNRRGKTLDSPLPFLIYRSMNRRIVLPTNYRNYIPTDIIYNDYTPLVARWRIKSVDLISIRSLGTDPASSWIFITNLSSTSFLSNWKPRRRPSFKNPCGIGETRRNFVRLRFERSGEKEKLLVQEGGMRDAE